MNLNKTKTIQFAQRKLQVPLPYLAGSVLCPTTALIKLWSHAGHLPPEVPAFTVQEASGKICAATPAVIRKKLSVCLSNIGVLAEQYGTHSLRRGGATWLLVSGVPVDTIKILGDWKSDSVFRYLTPDIRSKFHIIDKALVHLYER